MKANLLILLALLLLIGCKKDKPEIIAPVLPVCKPIKVTYEGLEYLYTYDGKDRLTNYVEPDRKYLKFEYDTKNRPVKVIYYYRDESQVYATEVIEYNAQGKWAKVSYSQLDNQNPSERIYEYDPVSGYRTKVTVFKAGQAQTSYAFEYNNSNMVKLSVTEHQYNADPYTYLFEYDTTHENKLASSEEIVPFGYYTFGFGNNGTPSKNMIKQINWLTPEGKVEFYTNYKYDYDANGYPTKLTILGQDLNGDRVVNDLDAFVYNYFYACK